MRHFVLAILCVGLSLANELPPQGVIAGHYPGRSGDVVVHLPGETERASLSFVTDADVSLRNIESARVGDLLSHLMGTTPLNPDDGRAGFPTGSIFDKPNANLLVVVDGALPIDVSFGHHVPIEDDTYPRDNLQLLTTLLASEEPTVHGIPRRTWFDKDKQAEVAAYDNWCPSRSGPTVANLFDVATHSFGGRSLMVSGSASEQLSKALCAKAYLLEDTNNNYGLFWSNDEFESVYSERSPLFALSKDRILEAIQTTISAEGASVRAVHANDASRLEYALADGRVATFDLKNVEDFALFAELQLVREVVAKVQTDDLTGEVHDEFPDFFAFGFSSVSAIGEGEGKESAKYLGAISLIREVVTDAVAQLSPLYGEQLLAQVVFLGGPAAPERQRALEQTILSAVGDSLATQPHEFEKYFPEMYLKSDADVAAVCEQVNALVAKFDASARAYCSADLEARSTDRRAGRGVPGFVGYMEKASSDDGNDVFIFQCVIWFNAILVVALAMAVYPIMGIESHMPQIVFRDNSGGHKKTG